MRSDEFKKGQLICVADDYYRVIGFRCGLAEAIRLLDGIIITLDADDYEHCSVADEKRFEREFTSFQITSLKHD